MQSDLLIYLSTFSLWPKKFIFIFFLYFEIRFFLIDVIFELSVSPIILKYIFLFVFSLMIFSAAFKNSNIPLWINNRPIKVKII